MAILEVHVRIECDKCGSDELCEIGDSMSDLNLRRHLKAGGWEFDIDAKQFFCLDCQSVEDEDDESGDDNDDDSEDEKGGEQR